MSQQVYLKQIFQTVIKQYDSNGQQSLKNNANQAIRRIIQMKKYIAEINEMIGFFKSVQSLTELKRQYDYSISKYTNKELQIFYRLKSVQLGWKKFLQKLNEKAQIQLTELQMNIKSLIPATLNQQMSKSNKQYRQITICLMNKYFKKMIEQTKRQGNQYCKNCTKIQIQLKEQIKQLKKIIYSKDQYIKAKHKQVQQKLVQIENLKSRQRQFRKYNHQSSIFVDQDDDTFDRIDKNILNAESKASFEIGEGKIQKIYINAQTQTERCETDEKEIQVKIYKQCLEEQIQTDNVWIKEIVGQKQQGIQTREQVKIIQSIEVQTESIEKIIEEKIRERERISESIGVETESMEEILKQKQWKFKQELRKYKLFCGEVFGFQEIYKLRLIDHIQSKSKFRIKSTHLLYRYDPINKQNFHRYIDNIQGLAFIVKSLKGVYLCGYYAGKLVPNQLLNDFGLIINLNQNESYEIKQEPHSNRVMKTMIYDDFYCIFGNAELRVKTWQDFVFSNFGIMGGYFNNRGTKVQEFLGEDNERLSYFSTYEFFQVKLDIEAEK